MTRKRVKAKIVGNKNTDKDLKFIQKVSLLFFKHPRKTALIWLILFVFGAASYTTFLKREGFPSIETPFAISNGTYLVNDPSKVDEKVSKPLNEFLLEQEGVKSVQSNAGPNFFTTLISYKENVDAEAKSAEIKSAIDEKGILPEQASFNVEPFKFGFTERGDDLVISFYSKNGASAKELNEKANQAVEFFKTKNIAEIEDISVIDPFQNAVNPLTGRAETAQKSFDRFGLRENNQNNFYNSAVIGVTAKEGVDTLALNDKIQSAVNELNQKSEFSEFSSNISASYAPDIRAQISELTKVLLEGLFVVLLIGTIIITFRASILTVISMITVLAIVNGILFLFGYSLNTITLFALILGLSLIIDDTIIMVEALDNQRRKQKTAKDAVSVATSKVGKAMITATLTAALSFAPLLFVSGILGSFIRAIPLTIMSSLFVSLIVALVFIPLFARYLLLRKEQIGQTKKTEFSTKVEASIAKTISAPMFWAQHSKIKLAGVGISAVLFSFAFIFAGGLIFKNVTFNIFPSSKDTNQLQITATFMPNTSLEQAEKAVDTIDKKVADRVGENFDKAAYYGQATIQKAVLTVNLTDYKERDIKSPELVDQLEGDFKNFELAAVEVSQLDAGPPGSAFTARINSETNREAALKLSNDIAAYLETAKINRIDGSEVKIKSVSGANSDIFTRDGKDAYVEVTASFVDTDTTTLVTLTKDAVLKEFTQDRVTSYGLNKDALSFDFGQEDENQDSFKTLAYAFPIVLLAIYIILAFQFRSFIQPLLIFMAIPFSFFGIALGLNLTDNAFSFFAMLGFFALIGLSIKNTILLTDYANQARRAGMNPVDAAHEALAERFRPLIATSLTAVVSLIPLAITSPFWEGLTVVLIFGLLSSTFLVLTVFPYYYLGGEFMRTKSKQFFWWFVHKF